MIVTLQKKCPYCGTRLQVNMDETDLLYCEGCGRYYKVMKVNKVNKK